MTEELAAIRAQHPAQQMWGDQRPELRSYCGNMVCMNTPHMPYPCWTIKALDALEAAEAENKRLRLTAVGISEIAQATRGERDAAIRGMAFWREWWEAAAVALTAVEWAGGEDGQCPDCERTQKRGHAPDCKLQAALAATAPAQLKEERA